MNTRTRILALGLCLLLAPAAHGSDLIMFGGDASRNFVSDETGLPGEWDLESGKNIKWVAELGSQTYAGPIYYDGKIFVGTNNEALKNPELKGIPVIIVSGVSSYKDLFGRDHATMPKPFAFIEKPVDADELLATIASAVGTKQEA